MLKLVLSIIIILHGLVHLLYFGQSWRLFELQPRMTWPDGSWAFSRRLGSETTRLLASIACVLAAIGFVVSGIAILGGLTWWRPLIVGAAVFSSLLYALFWNGRMQQLDNQGVIGMLINGVVLITVLILRWPDFGF